MKLRDRLRQWFGFAGESCRQAKDSRKGWEQAIIDMQEDLLWQQREALAAAIYHRQRTEQEYQKAIGNKNHWMFKAATAKDFSNPSEVWKASENFYYYRQGSHALKADLDSQQNGIKVLKRELIQLESEISGAKTDNDIRIASAQVARIEKSFNNKSYCISDHIERMEAHVRDLENHNHQTIQKKLAGQTMAHAFERMEKYVQSLEDKFIYQPSQKKVKKSRNIQEDLQELQQSLTEVRKTQQILETQYEQALGQVKSFVKVRNSPTEHCNLLRWHLHRHIILIKQMENTQALLDAHCRATSGQKLLRKAHDRMLRIAKTPHLLQLEQVEDLQAARQQLKQTLADTMTALKMAEQSYDGTMKAANIWSGQADQALENFPLSYTAYKKKYTESAVLFLAQVDRLKQCHSWQQTHLVQWDRQIYKLLARWKS